MVEFTNEQYLELSKIVDITIANEYCHLNGEELKKAWLIEYGKSVYARAWLDGHDCAMNENEERQWVDLTDDEIDESWCIEPKPINGLLVAEPVKQEPIGEVDPYMDFLRINWKDGRHPPKGAKLYAAPVSAKREWVDLTDYEIVRLYAESPMCDSEMIAFARTVIAAFKEKNQ